MIISYFVSQGYTALDIQTLGNRSASNLIYSFFFCHNQIDNEDFLREIRSYIMSDMDKLNMHQLKKIIDIYKFNTNFANQQMKLLLEEKLEQKVHDKENKSEEDDFHLFEKALWSATTTAY